LTLSNSFCKGIDIAYDSVFPNKNNSWFFQSLSMYIMDRDFLFFKTIKTFFWQKSCILYYYIYVIVFFNFNFLWQPEMYFRIYEGIIFII
jgi:hypothetical protein